MVLLFIFSLLFYVIKVSSLELSTTTKVPDKSSLLQSSRAVTIDDFQDLRLQISQQNTKIVEQNAKFEHQNARLAQQDTRIAQELTRFAVQNTKLAEQDTKIAQGNTRYEAQNVKLSDQNTKLAEQNIKILEQNTKIKDLERKIEEMEKQGNPHIQLPSNNSTYKGIGSIFTRWGRRDCPANISQLVYSGITGGSYYGHTGGAAEYVCLPPDPIWNVDKYFNGPHWGYMYGTEYEDITKPIRDYKVPCAVCRASQFSTVLMIPARSECYPGWQKAYHGELVSGENSHNVPSQYVCLDDDPQTNGTNTSEIGKLMYPVRAKCGSLPCPPYEDNTLLTCVVCLK